MAVVSWAHWQTRFNRDPAILGRQIVLNGVPARVIGVAPREFFGLRVGFTPDVWVPAAMETLIQRPSRRATGDLPLGLMARLKPGVSIEQARAEMRVLDRYRVEGLATASKNPVWRQASIYVEPAGAGLSRLRDHLATPLLSLTAIVALLLLLTCTNVAGMMVARGASRRREMATRVALGADRVRLVRQVLTESLLLSTAGGLLGVFLAYFGAGALVRLWLLNVDVRARGPQHARAQRPPRSAGAAVHRRTRAADGRPGRTVSRVERVCARLSDVAPGNRRGRRTEIAAAASRRAWSWRR